ncbi:MAG: PAS domain S-box protein [Bdellovibrionota bacterium]
MRSSPSFAVEFSWAPAGALFLCAAIFAIDITTPLGIADGILYVAPVLFCLFASKRRHILSVTALAMVLTIAGYFLSPRSSIPSHFVVVNRVISLIGVGVAALVVLLHLNTREILREDQKREQQYLTLADVFFVIFDRQGRVASINQKGSELLGLSGEEIVGKDWIASFIPAEHRAQVKALFDKFQSGKTEDGEYLEYPILQADGSQRFIGWRNTALRDPDGKFQEILSAGLDLTEKRQMLQHLKELNYAIDQAAIVARTDASGVINYVNDKFCEISKYSREELLGKDHRIVNSGFHSKAFMADLWKTILSGKVWRGELRNKAKDGTHYWVDTTIVPFLGEDGTPRQFLAIRGEITARKKAEERLREQAALARLGEMAAIVAHEVKNPLAGIGGAIQILGSKFPSESREKTIVGEILSRIGSLNETIQDLLLYSRPTPPRLQPLDILGLLQRTTELLKKDPKLARIDVAVDGKGCAISGDAEQLSAVFLNLLLNAAQAMEGSGSIRVSAETADGHCSIRIQDKGPGIPPEIRDKVFEPFFTTKARGTGLGLAAAKRIVEVHGGAIEFKHPAGGGTVVEVRFPSLPH